MAEYNLLLLSWSDFENLTKDLLEKRFGVYIESFTAGRDEGIDLRFSISKDRKAIVQCKRYDSYSNLLSHLKKEASLIKKKEVERYYLSTTVGLTPKRKKEIHELFSPLIKDEADIFGKSEINSLLSTYKDVEIKYYKLWLSSVNVLKRILHSKVYNTTHLDQESFHEILKVYVQNDSMQKAKAILERYHYVIISGIPGIGKTILAKMLVYILLANGVEEMISLTQTINEAYDFFHEAPSQVFFYDDFLGRNFLEAKLDRNEDQQLIKFIKMVKQSKNKYLVMTTREYILKQAQIKYELLDKHDVDVAKCMIDLAQYTKLIRAKILYNHLYFSEMPSPVMHQIVGESRYTRIIEHPNYNPRIIETVLERKDWEVNKNKPFFNVFLGYFNNPIDVWRHAFENQITPLCQQVLIVAGSIDGNIEYSNLKKVTECFIMRYNRGQYTASFEIEYDTALKEMEGSFLKVEKDCESTFVVSFVNPSISDFLRSYLSEKTELTKNLLESSKYIEQVITLYTLYENEDVDPQDDSIVYLCEKNC